MGPESESSSTVNHRDKMTSSIAISEDIIRLAGLYKEYNLISKEKVEKKTNVLHMAANIGLPNFIREIVDSNPELAFGFDEDGFTPCHLAVARCHASVVKQLLLSKVGVDICCLNDAAGFLPVHAAVMTGNYDVFQYLWGSCTVSTLKELTPHGDNILHLALKYENSDAFWTISRVLSWNKCFFDPVIDANGSTLLHIAVIKQHLRQQVEIIKVLVGHRNGFVQFMRVATCHPNMVEVNALNKDGLTALDILDSLAYEDEGQREEIENVIMKGGGKRASDLVQDTHIQFETPATKASPFFNTFLLLWQVIFFTIRIGFTRPVLNDKDRETCNTLMVVATLIAAMTFQGVMSPPGGLIQSGSGLGQAVLQEHLHNYLLYDMVAFILALIVILLTVYVVPRWKELINLAMLTIWASVLYTTWSFLYGVNLVYPHLATNVWINILIYFGGIAVLSVGLFLFIQAWYNYLLRAVRSKKLKYYGGDENKITAGFFVILGAALVLILTVSVTLVYHFFYDQQSYRSQLTASASAPSP